MTLQQIHYALTIEECGSMNKAAEKLFMVQSALTASVKELEKEVGITIFVRGPKGVTPTPEGREFYSNIKVTAEDLETVEILKNLKQS